MGPALVSAAFDGPFDPRRSLIFPFELRHRFRNNLPYEGFHLVRGLLVVTLHTHRMDWLTVPQHPCFLPP